MPSDDRRAPPPVLNPVLTLRKEPVPETATGGGKGEAAIVADRLEQQRHELSASCERIAGSAAKRPTHAGRLHLVADMFPDSLAPSWTPHTLFGEQDGCRLVAPMRNGYLVEANAAQLSALARTIRDASTIERRVAISRVASIRAFEQRDMLRGRTIDELWSAAEEVEGGKAFIMWLAPFRDTEARSSVLQALAAAENEKTLLATFPAVLLPPPGPVEANAAAPIMLRGQSGLARAARRYRQQGVARTFIAVPSKAAFQRIVGSGASFRMDPVRRIEVTAPGAGAEPSPPLPNVASQPVVAFVDGGLSARSYMPLEAWRAPPLIRDGASDSSHGNRIASLLVHAHAWNSNLDLPQLVCRLGTVQAIPRENSNTAANPEQLIQYLRQVVQRSPDTKVWNMSFNEVAPNLDPEEVSYLGHEIGIIAREFGILPVISIGNKRAGNSELMCPPADCEAALTVGGRAHGPNGEPAGTCPVSLLGPAPGGMLKPDLSWFSRLRMLGGSVQMGSSYAATLVSSLAAHTFSNLKEPTPDLVRALLINSTGGDTHHQALGWGTPWDGTFPWACAPGTVTLAWKGKLRPGYAYYWNDIPIPPELVHNGRLRGRGRLTAILNPVLSDLTGANYFSSRLQVALQYVKRDGSIGNLLGSMKEDKARELDARRACKVASGATPQPRFHAHRRHVPGRRHAAACSGLRARSLRAGLGQPPRAGRAGRGLRADPLGRNGRHRAFQLHDPAAFHLRRERHCGPGDRVGTGRIQLGCNGYPVVQPPLLTGALDGNQLGQGIPTRIGGQPKPEQEPDQQQLYEARYRHRALHAAEGRWQAVQGRCEGGGPPPQVIGGVWCRSAGGLAYPGRGRPATLARWERATHADGQTFFRLGHTLPQAGQKLQALSQQLAVRFRRVEYHV